MRCGDCPVDSLGSGLTTDDEADPRHMSTCEEKSSCLSISSLHTGHWLDIRIWGGFGRERGWGYERENVVCYLLVR